MLGIDLMFALTLGLACVAAFLLVELIDGLMQRLHTELDKWACPYCGTTVGDDRPACPYCGTRVHRGGHASPSRVTLIDSNRKDSACRN